MVWEVCKTEDQAVKRLRGILSLMSDDDREKKREESREYLNALRLDPMMPERAFRLLELFADRLDRLETGSFPTEETPTQPERKASGSHFAAVTRELERGRKDGE